MLGGLKMVTERTTKEIRLNSGRITGAGEMSFRKARLIPDDKVWVLKEDIIKEFLAELYDDDNCDYDHHNYCQTHPLSERPCVMERLKKFLFTSPPDNIKFCNIQEEHYCNKIHSPPDSIIEKSEQDSSLEDIDELVLKKDSEVDANRSLQQVTSSLVAPEGSTPSAFGEDSYIQEEVIHCPKQECKGMLLTSPYKHELKCSDCGKYFIINESIEEVSK